VAGISQIYEGRERRFHALGEISFGVAEGDFVSIVGASGTGKSTLLRILGGLLTPSAGQVWLDGRQVTAPPADVAFVFQKNNLMPWRTVWQNALLPLEVQGKVTPAEEAEVRQALALVGLTDFAQTYPAQLSGGMAQRVTLARALVQRPRLLLLDEPFGALDALTRERLNLELMALQGHIRQTVVMVTHSIDEALLLSVRVLVLRGQPGRIHAQVDVPFPRPRSIDLYNDPTFNHLRLTVRREIGE
jgi:NitT/TauT family transport system ATP-binding protein